jgi:DNA-binding transcriptional LysR family regulator
MINTPPNLLRALVTYIDRKWFLETASDLAQDQPVIYFQIKMLEDILGIDVYDPKTGLANWSNAVSLCYKYARQIIDLYDEITSKLAQIEVDQRRMVGVAEDNSSSISAPSVAAEITYVPTNLLRTFIMYLDQNWYAKSSDQLLKEQPEVHFQIQTLDTMAGIGLYDPATRKPNVNPAFEIWADFSCRILDMHDEMISKLVAIPTRTRLRIGLPQDYADRYVFPFVQRVVTEGLDIHFDFVSDTTGALLQDFHNDKLDIVLAMTDPWMGGLAFQWSETLCWVCRPDRDPPYRDESGSFEPRLVVAVAEDGCMYRRTLMSVFRRDKQSNYRLYPTPNLSHVEISVREGHGVAIIPKRNVHERFVILENMPPLPDLSLGIYVNPSRRGAIVRHTATLLGETIFKSNAKENVPKSGA